MHQEQETNVVGKKIIEPSFFGRLSLFYKYLFYAISLWLILAISLNALNIGMDLTVSKFLAYILVILSFISAFFLPKQITIENNTFYYHHKHYTLTDYDFMPLLVDLASGALPSVRKIKLTCRRTDKICYVNMNGYSKKQIIEIVSYTR